MSRVASGLLSTVRVLGTLPIIRCAPGGAAEMLARELNALLKENISSRGPAQALFEVGWCSMYGGVYSVYGSN